MEHKSTALPPSYHVTKSYVFVELKKKRLLVDQYFTMNFLPQNITNINTERYSKRYENEVSERGAVPVAHRTDAAVNVAINAPWKSVAGSLKKTTLKNEAKTASIYCILNRVKIEKSKRQQQKNQRLTGNQESNEQDGGDTPGEKMEVGREGFDRLVTPFQIGRQEPGKAQHHPPDTTGHLEVIVEHREHCTANVPCALRYQVGRQRVTHL